LQHVGKFSPGGAVADFLSLASAIIAGLPRRKRGRHISHVLPGGQPGTEILFRNRARSPARDRFPPSTSAIFEHEQEHEHDYEAGFPIRCLEVGGFLSILCLFPKPNP
jgi:hypothetical protein